MSKTTLALIGKFAVTGLLLYFVLRNVALGEVTARLAEMSAWPMVGAVALIGLQAIAVVTWRWESIVSVIDGAVARWRLTGVVVISLFFNQVLPSTVGGDGIRMWLLRRLGRPLGIAVRSVIIDRILGLLGLLLLSLAGAVTLLVQQPGSLPVWAAAAVSLGGIVAIAGAPLLLRIFAWIPADSLRRHLATIAQEVQALHGNNTMLVRLIAISVLGHIFISLAIWCLALGIGVHLPLVQTLAVLPAVLLAAALPISVAGWGVREGGMVLGLGLLGVTTSDAALVSVFYGLLQLAFGIAGGLLWLLYRGPKPSADETAAIIAPLATTSASTKAETE